MILEKKNCVVEHSIISANYIIDTQPQEWSEVYKFKQ